MNECLNECLNTTVHDILPGVKGNLHDPGGVTLPPGHYPTLSHAVNAD